MDPRYYVPPVILLVAVAVLPVTWAAKNLFAGTRILASVAICVLFGATVLGYPSRSGHNTGEMDHSQAWDAIHFTDRRRASRNFITQRRFSKLLKQQSGIVLSDIDPVYLNALLSKSFVAAPIDGNHHYKWSEVWRYDRPQALALVQRALEQSLPVYALFVSQEDMTSNKSRLPTVAGYSWQALNNIPGKTQILKLVPITGNETAPSPG